MFSSKPKSKATVGLDIEADSIAATEVRGKNGSQQLGRTAIGPLAPGVVVDGEIRNAEALAASLKQLFAKNKLGKTVRVGIANQGVVVRTMRMPLIEDPDELATAVRFQAQDQIPMPLDQAVLDYQPVAKQAGQAGDRHMDVIAIAARRDMVDSLLGTLRSAGLEPVGIDLSAFGMIRALDGGEGAPVQGTTLYCHLGDVTNLAVASNGACLFTRLAPVGLEAIAADVADGEDLEIEDAREWLLDVGFDEPVEGFGEDRDRAAGVREALEEGASKLVDELRLSLDFYGAQEGATPIERVVVCGPGSMIEGLPERIQVGLGLAIESRTPAALSRLNEEDAARLTISYGLALEG